MRLKALNIAVIQIPTVYNPRLYFQHCFNSFLFYICVLYNFKVCRRAVTYVRNALSVKWRGWKYAKGKNNTQTWKSCLILHFKRRIPSSLLQCRLVFFTTYDFSQFVLLHLFSITVLYKDKKKIRNIHKYKNKINTRWRFI